MALGREVHHRVGLVGREHLAHRGGIGDVGADQHVTGWLRASSSASSEAA